MPLYSGWADEHHHVQPDALPAAIAADQVPWDPSVQALLPFPSVLGMMASAMPWTQELGDAFLAQQQDVMDAVQRMRQRARDFGYLRSTAAYTVSNGPYIEIMPLNPGLVVVPYNDPAVVFVAPRRGFAVTSAIRVGFGVRLGVAFAPWGWGSTRFAWGERAVIVNNVRWGRTWTNRATYVHPYAARRYAGPRPAEGHRLIERSPREREDERNGRARREEHHR